MISRDKIAVWVCRNTFIPYRFKKSFVKRLIPTFMHDYPFEQDYFGHVYKGNTSNYIDRIVYLCGAYEKYMLYLLRDLVSLFSLGEGTFLDVGANVGNHALYMSSLMKKIHAFEPYDKVCNELINKIKANKIKNIYVHQTGLSDKKTVQPFYAPQGRNFGTGSFCPDFKTGGNLYKSLPVTSGDLFIQENNITNINIIKIDVEGHERSVLAGLGKTFKLFRPIIIFEMSPDTFRTFKNSKDFTDKFPHDYSFLRFVKANRDSGKYTLTEYEFGSNYKYQDVIVMPDDKFKILRDSMINLNLKQFA